MDAEYIQYGPEWEAHLKKLPKVYLINLLRGALIRNQLQPDLLEALKQIREIGGFSGLDHLKSVADLIAKTEGRAE